MWVKVAIIISMNNWKGCYNVNKSLTSVLGPHSLKCLVFDFQTLLFLSDQMSFEAA